MEHELAGTVELSRPRVYPLDPQHHAPHRTEVTVEPGTYPVYRTGLGGFYWLMTGRASSMTERHGDGLMSVSGTDQGIGPELTFPSRVYGREEWLELMADPAVPVTFHVLAAVPEASEEKGKEDT